MLTFVKSYSVGNGDMFLIQHDNSTITLIDCCLNGDYAHSIIQQIENIAKQNDFARFISTHPDLDHFQGIEKISHLFPKGNFYTVRNEVNKPYGTPSFPAYKALRDSGQAFEIKLNAKRAWATTGNLHRGGSGLSFLWPDTKNPAFQLQLLNSNNGESPNNISPIIRYVDPTGVSFLWMGDLETDFMNSIEADVFLEKTNVLFAPHHGRQNAMLPASWMEAIDPDLVVIGEAPSKHLNYYSDKKTIKQNSAGDILLCPQNGRIDVYTSQMGYSEPFLVPVGIESLYYCGSLEVNAPHPCAFT